MLIDSFAAPMFATNCWVIATEPGAECVVIDPGMPDVSHQLTELLEKHNLKPVAVIATHGHLDHTFSIQGIADGYGIATLSGMNLSEPKDVRELRNADVIDLVGLSFKAIHAPGHTRGSLMFEVSNEVLVSGDVLFAGSIGRTDLPTGSSKDMEETLRKKVVPLSDHLRVLPGHGPETTMAHEKKNNPYLKSLVGRY